MRTKTPRPILLKDYRPSQFQIEQVDLDIYLGSTATRVRSRLRIFMPRISAADISPLILDGENLELAGIKIDGTPLTSDQFALTDDALTVHNPPAHLFTLEITTIVNPDANKALQGIYRSRGVYCSQCEAQGFRRITYFLDRPDILSRYRVRLEADVSEAPVLLANGNLVERGTFNGGKRHYTVWRDPFPKPCYLFAIVGGDLASIASTFTTMSGRNVDLRVYVEHGKEERAAWAMDSLKRAMRWDERRFKREYDLDIFSIVAVSDFNMGAMENKGLNIFNDKLILASKDTATDAAFERIESVVAHEYFHNWTGNRITCRDWFQLCLKEGLTVYRDQEFSGDERSKTVQRITDVRDLKTRQFAEDAGPLAHPVRPESYIEINNFYTATVYEKGAELVRMIETLVGHENFAKGMDLYFQRHDGHAATVEDFIVCFEDATGRDLKQFRLWYSQAGTPELVCSLKYDARSRTARLNIQQRVPATPGQPKKKPHHIPIRVGLVGPDGRDMPLHLEGSGALPSGILELTKSSQSFTFTDVNARPVPSLLRGFSAPVKLDIDLSDQDYELLIASDSDHFNRWQAVQNFAMRLLVKRLKNDSKGRQRTLGKFFAAPLETALISQSLEPSYAAELLRLPTASDLARELKKNVDPGQVFRIHQKFVREVGTALGPLLEEFYLKASRRETYSPDAANNGRRALRNAALSLLAARGTPADMERLSKHYFKAANMTDAAHALQLLASSKSPDREKALDHFYDRWKDDHLVIDTWFSIQALSPLPGTLRHIKALTKHPLFSLKAPNKVRALIGTFGQANLAQFHKKDGAGYRFVADHVMAIDQFNPQIAARILGVFQTWASLEPERRSHAKRALVAIMKSAGRSRDVLEIADKMLEM